MAKKTNTKQKGWELRKRRGRQYNIRPVRKRFLIVTNGQTEALYFDHYRGPSGPTIKVVFRAKDPLTLVGKAIVERERRAKEGRSFDETWVVLDRDCNKQDPKDDERFKKAIEMARNNKIEIACSNESFELWYVLHYQDISQSLSRTELVGLLESHIGRKYKKGKESDLFSEVLHRREDALRRAKKLVDSSSNDERNPSTGVHILVEKLLANNT